MDYRIIALDIDGTLTNSKKLMTQKTKEALLEAQEKGIIVVLASGRPTPGIIALADQLELSKYGGYILSFNGGYVYDCKAGKALSQQCLPDGILCKLINFAKEENVNILTYEDSAFTTENPAILTENPDCYYTGLEAKLNHMNIKPVSDLNNYVNFPITKCLMLADGEHLAKVEEKAKVAFGSILNIFRSEPYFLEIMPQNIDKAYTLSKLLEHLNLDVSQLIACGDGYNDVTMIEYAGLGVAMENAQDPVKVCADVMAGHNDSDGLVPIIEKYLLS